MKMRITYFLLTAFLFSFVACTKELSNEKGFGTGQGVNGKFYATIGGNQWNADSLQLIQVGDSGGVSINGLSKTGEQISMILPAFKTGTYTLDVQSASIALYSNLLDSAVNVYVSNIGTASGTVTISSIDTVNHLVNGSFQLSLVNPADNSTKTITRGVFSNVPYSGGNGNITVNNGSDTVKAVINGNNFHGAQVEVTTLNGQLFISGISADGTQDLGLIMPVNITPGSYNMDFASGMYIGVYYPIASVTLVSQSNGTLTIISNNTAAKQIKGTFSFIASSLTDATTATVAQGYFSVSY